MDFAPIRESQAGTSGTDLHRLEQLALHPLYFTRLLAGIVQGGLKVSGRNHLSKGLAIGIIRQVVIAKQHSGHAEPVGSAVDRFQSVQRLG